MRANLEQRLEAELLNVVRLGSGHPTDGERGGGRSRGVQFVIKVRTTKMATCTDHKPWPGCERYHRRHTNPLGNRNHSK